MPRFAAGGWSPRGEENCNEKHNLISIHTSNLKQSFFFEKENAEFLLACTAETQLQGAYRRALVKKVSSLITPTEL